MWKCAGHWWSLFRWIMKLSTKRSHLLRKKSHHGPESLVTFPLDLASAHIPPATLGLGHLCNILVLSHLTSHLGIQRLHRLGDLHGVFYLPATRGHISNCCSAFLPSASLLLVSLLCLHVWGDVVSACIMSTEPCSEAFGTPDRLVSTHWYYACACVCTCAYCTIMYICYLYVCLTCILCSRLRSTPRI